jgi:hypothetical protein
MQIDDANAQEALQFHPNVSRMDASEWIVFLISQRVCRSVMRSKRVAKASHKLYLWSQPRMQQLPTLHNRYRRTERVR